MLCYCFKCRTNTISKDSKAVEKKKMKDNVLIKTVVRDNKISRFIKNKKLLDY